ncbi:MAG: excinuclease ABC subunit UvrB [Bacteroidales bacterium]
MDFKLTSEYSPTGDQPEAVRQLVEGFRQGETHQTLLGVTGSGKTFTVANMIQELGRPVLVLSHNKTLAAQLYSEFKQFFPDNAVEYFVSYYDYYQPEAYLPVTDTYIEKDLSINDEIEKLRLSTTSSLLSGRRDVIVVSSVSCLYGIGNPDDFHDSTVRLAAGDHLSRNVFLRKLVDALYSRNEVDFKPGTFRVRGDTVDIHLAYADQAFRVEFWGDEIDAIKTIHPVAGHTLDTRDEAVIFPANIFITSKNRMKQAIEEIQDDMMKQVEFFRSEHKLIEAQRIEERVTYDLEMIRELGYCPGIENYSRYFDGRSSGTRPFCLLDYFPSDFLTVIDESHVTLPQIHAMYGGDYSRKKNLVEYGFRLPAAVDNRPLKFPEFEDLIGQTLFVSATPANYELERCGGVIVEQVIRPTGLVDPEIELQPSHNQIDHLVGEINKRIRSKERVLVTTLTKRMAEELSSYLVKLNIRTRYIHSDIDTLDRIEILEGLRKGSFDVLVGINLLREGLDLPEVSLVAILDADKEGFLRSERSLTQTAGRAARNLNGKVIMYADKITDSMRRTIEETERRRKKQMAYNEEHGITPTQITKSTTSLFDQNKEEISRKGMYADQAKTEIAADPVVRYMGERELEQAIETSKKKMEKAAAELDFIEAARFRDEMYAYQELLKEKTETRDEGSPRK